MRSVLVEMTGQRFGRLVVTRRDGSYGKKAKWRAMCDCGKEVSVVGYQLRSGKTKSCGCLHREKAAIRASTFRLTHGHARKGIISPTWRSWHCMINRRRNPHMPGYSRYGGRGIKVCDRWQDSFENFLSDMGERPTGKTIDRKDNNGNYEPGNCKWSTPKKQSANRQISHKSVIAS